MTVIGNMPIIEEVIVQQGSPDDTSHIHSQTKLPAQPIRVVRDRAAMFIRRRMPMLAETMHGPHSIRGGQIRNHVLEITGSCHRCHHPPSYWDPFPLRASPGARSYKNILSEKLNAHDVKGPEIMRPNQHQRFHVFIRSARSSNRSPLPSSGYYFRERGCTESSLHLVAKASRVLITRWISTRTRKKTGYVMGNARLRHLEVV